MIGALIGLGVLSAGYSIYSNIRNNKQVDKANEINRNASQLSYQAQKETNEMNYRIFKETQDFNSPANLKSMYDSLGLNGDAIVANQGFVPTAAPNMVAPQMAQQQFSFYDDTNMRSGADRLMKSLVDGLSMQKVKSEIEETGQRMILMKAQTSECEQSTRNLIKDALLKDQDISQNDLDYILKSNEVDTINQRNAELMLTVEGLKDTLSFNRNVRPKILKQYDDKHLTDWLDSCMKQIDVKYHEKEIKMELTKLWADVKNTIKQGKILDLDTLIKQSSYAITQLTLPSEVYKTIYENTEKGEESRKSLRKYEWLDPENGSNVLDTFMRQLADCFTTVMSAILQPLQGLVSLGK